MIKTVTLNPAIDKTIEIDDFKVGTVNRISSIRLDAGGKGINVSKIIKILEGESRAYGILAGSNGDYIKNYIDALKIKNDFLFVNGETRTNIKVVDRVRHTNTDINEPGLKIAAKDMDLLEKKIFSDMDMNSMLVLSGSIPLNVSSDIYRKWIERAKGIGAKTILDADGELLKEGIKAGPYLIKPNIHELEKLVNKKLESINEVINAGKSLLDYGIEIVVVSLGGDGAVFIKREIVIHADGIKVNVVSTVGAGDSMVAALALSIDEGYPFERAVTLSVASGTANVTTSGTQPPQLSDILNYEKEVCYRYIK